MECHRNRVYLSFDWALISQVRGSSSLMSALSSVEDETEGRDFGLAKGDDQHIRTD